MPETPADPGGSVLPFTPIRNTVYAPDELFAGFDPDDPDSYAATMDFAAYRWFVATGRSTPTDPYPAMMRALHDSSLTLDVGRLIAGERVVGIMGGHQLPRTSDEYRAVAELGRDLARRGMLVLSGGGPGAMEAAHLGAALSRHPQAELDSAISTLGAAPTMPRIQGIVAPDGRPDERLVRAAHDWMAPAWTMSRAIVDPAPSLSIPTWHYGHEPTTPFATRIAKLFQNSIREDGLLTVATQGIVFTAGSAGTLQEVFQDAEQNFYAPTADDFSPMIFLGRDYWTRVLPVASLVDTLFATAEPVVAQERTRRILVTDDIDEAVAHLEAFTPARSRLARVQGPRHPSVS
ncbi:LOG family protein [Pseudolysinimonas sp.]|uniref:LOG family protein n=1 Tax=Pseudolysinimonas sp. TaxID=2680009 RepID=UPI003F7ECD53